jgi:hypothetical protein
MNALDGDGLLDPQSAIIAMTTTTSRQIQFALKIVF